MRYNQKRSYAWSKSIAYAAGLIASDGCLQKDGRHIDLTSIDIEQLTNFQNAIGRQLTISKKANRSARQAFRIQFSDVALYDFLVAAGISPAKSKTIGAIHIPDKYYTHFLRGVFDGDGTVYGYWDVRWRSSFMYYATFTSASLDFLDFLQNENIRILDLSKGSIRTGKQAYSLVYAKADSLKLCKALYTSDTALFLNRKRIKFESFIGMKSMIY